MVKLPVGCMYHGHQNLNLSLKHMLSGGNQLLYLSNVLDNVKILISMLKMLK